jgi:hypothetical protein
VLFNQLFLHTTKSLWRTFAEPAATLQGANISDIVLGTGDLFARPSQEIFTASGGYGGTISQFGGVYTNIGYVFPDVLQGKIFGLVVGDGGPYLKELSEDGIQSFSHKNMALYLTQFPDAVYGENNVSNVTTENAYLIDNPYNNIGFTGGYDFKLKRFWIVKHPTKEEADILDPGFTLSYSTILNKWFSFHSYQPNAIVSIDNRTLFLRNKVRPTITSGTFWEANSPKAYGKCHFFGSTTPFPSSIEIVSASATEDSKTYQNLVIKSFSKDNQIKVRDDNFNTLQVHTERMNTGDYSLIQGNTFAPTKIDGQAFYKYRNDEYRIFVPRDSVIDNADDIFDITNLDNTQRFKERIKGNYANFVLTYNNTGSFDFFLKQINIIFNQNIR